MGIFKDMHEQRMFDSDWEYTELRRMLSEAISKGYVEQIPVMKKQTRFSEDELRGLIMRSRRTTADVAYPASASRDRERASRQNIVATLRLRIKNLEEKNRKLTGLLELVYGELALAREQNASVGSAP